MIYPTLIERRSAGLYCTAGDFYIDPWKPVTATALITHSHSDHAVPGSRRYVGSREGDPLLRLRLGDEASLESLDYGERWSSGDAVVSLHLAGHIRGSAQVRIEAMGKVAVVSGDYKRQHDATATPFELVTCDEFVTESTFGLPIYRWPDSDEVVNQINDWWRQNQANGRASVLFAYALGKAQRILSAVDATIGPIFTHGAVQRFCDAYRDSGVALPSTTSVVAVSTGTRFNDALIVAPPSARGTTWMKRFRRYSTGLASGWMRVRGMRRRRAIDRGFVLSDHADWQTLLSTIQQTGAQQVFTTHGYSESVARRLIELGIKATPLSTAYIGELLDEAEDAEPK